jgi:hypothetical protein
MYMYIAFQSAKIQPEKEAEMVGIKPERKREKRPNSL